MPEHVKRPVWVQKASIDQSAGSPGVSLGPVSNHPRLGEVLRAVREARGVTQEGWAGRLGVSRSTVQRWERGERVPDPGAEAGILAYCREQGLPRSFEDGPLAGVRLTTDALQLLIEAARLNGGSEPADRGRVAVSPIARTNLPAPLTSFVGRSRERASIRQSLGSTRLITLTGVGGCGKSRLAQEVGRDLLGAYAHGVWLVELAPLTDPLLVPRAVAAALGVHVSDHSSVTTVLTQYVAPRRLLLLLDNCEHLLSACAELAETLLRACPDLHILATSREALGVIGESIRAIPTLSHRDATALFVERARLQRPDGFQRSADRTMAGEICRKLDGIPLAIELAAARLRMLSVEQIDARLSDRFRLLRGGNRVAMPRHQTLRAALDWSYDLLSPSEQGWLRCLSVFAGGFTLEAAESVGSAAAFECVGRLVDKSLVVTSERDVPMRYRLLETVRQYAREKLEEAGEAADACRRHRDWYLELAHQADSQLLGAEQPAWLARLETENDNLRAAMTWSLAQGADDADATLRITIALVRFWVRHGHLHEGRRWLTRALAVGSNAAPALRAWALHGHGSLAYMQGDYQQARAVCESSLTLFREVGDRRGIADALLSLDSIALRQGDYAAAASSLDASLALHTALGNTPGIAGVQAIRGLLALRQGNHSAARVLFEERLAIQRAMGNVEGIADTLEDLATVAGELGDTGQQMALLEEVLILQQSLGNKSGVAMAIGNLGTVAWAQRDHGRALRLLRKSLTFYREIGDRRGIARALGNLSFVSLYQSDYPRAIAFCREGLATSLASGDHWAIGRYLPVLAGAMYAKGHTEHAARLFGAAAALREGLGTPLPPVVRSTHDRTVAAVRAALGEDAFREAWAAAATMSADEAVACALAGVEQR
jgi:non-specific serine/threonine protein kinase